MANTIVWADIPVTDLERARSSTAPYYGRDRDHAGMESVALLPGEPGDVSADLALTENMKPGTDGTTIYLNSRGDPEGMLERVAAAGGKVLLPVTDMGSMVGFIGFFLDSEGEPHRRAQAAGGDELTAARA